MSTNATPLPPSARRGGFRVTTIIWGAILVTFAAIALVSALGGGAALTPAAVLWGVLGFGGLIVLFAIVAGVVAAVRSARGPGIQREADVAPASIPQPAAAETDPTIELFGTPDKDQPIG